MNTRSGKLPLINPSTTPKNTDLKKKNKPLNKPETASKPKSSISYSSNTPKVDRETVSEQKSLKIEELSTPFISPNLTPTEANSSLEEEIVLEITTEIVIDQPSPVNMAAQNDRFNEPMWNRIRTIAPTPGSAIVKPEMAANFAVKGNHMKMIQENQFDGHFLSDPYKHIADFEEICEMFRYGPNTDEPVKLRLFSLSLTGESKSWFNELEAQSIETWEQMKDAFAHRFFPPGLAQKMINDIRSFKQYEKENLIDAWIRLQNMIRKCHGHGLDKEQILNIFYYGLDEDSQILLDSAGGGIFLYKSANDAYKIMEDKVMMRMSKSKGVVDKPIKKMVAFAETKEDGSEVVAKLDQLASRLDNRFGKMEKDLYALKYGCEHCGGSHNTEECDTPGVHDQRNEDANYVQNSYQGNNQRGWNQTRNQGNFNSGFNSNINNFANRYPRNNQQYPQRPRDDIPIQQQSPSKPNGEEITLSSLHRLMSDFIDQQKMTNATVNSKLETLKKNMEQGQRNQQASISDLEKRMDRISDNNINRPIGTLPSNTQQNPRPIVPPAPGASTSNSNQRYQPPPARNEQVNAISTINDNICCSKGSVSSTVDPVLLVPEPVEDDFEDEENEIDTIIKITQPEDGDSNLHIKDEDNELKNFRKEEAKTTDNKEKSVSTSSHLPPKQGDPGSFLITCCLNDTMMCNGLADLGASINLMPNSLYKRLSLEPLKPFSIGIQLADQSILSPLGIAENVLLRVRGLTFPVDFVVIDLVENTNVPLILGRPFLNTTDAVIHIRQKEIILGIKKRVTLKVNKSTHDSSVISHTCYTVDKQDLGQRVEGEPHEPAELVWGGALQNADEEPSDPEPSDEESDEDYEPSEAEDDQEQEDKHEFKQREPEKPESVIAVENFKQQRGEYLGTAWQRMIGLMRACPEDSVSNEGCVLFFYLGLDEYAKHSLNETAGGSFLSIPVKDACMILHTQLYVKSFRKWLYESVQRREQNKRKREATGESSPKEAHNNNNIIDVEHKASTSGGINYHLTKAVQVLKFEQGDEEGIDDAWGRINELRQSCPAGEFSDTDFMYHFYNGLNDCAQEALDMSTDKFFLYLPYRSACMMLNERVYEPAYQECLEKKKKKQLQKDPYEADTNFINSVSTHEDPNAQKRDYLMHTLCEQTVTFGKVEQKLKNLLSEIQDDQQFGNMGNRKLESRIKDILDTHLDCPLGMPRINELFKEMFIRERQPALRKVKRTMVNIDEAEYSKKQKLEFMDSSEEGHKTPVNTPQVSPDHPNTQSMRGSDYSIP